VGFDQSFSFIYSRRPGTPAASLPDDVPDDVKSQRLARLQQLLDSQGRAISRGMVGTKRAGAGCAALAARRAAARRPHREQPLGEFRRRRGTDQPVRDVEITEAMNNSLRGRLVGLSAEREELRA
jgi:tRNA-2-methylthio-N6-dimethylallyladenosine synthase